MRTTRNTPLADFSGQGRTPRRITARDARAFSVFWDLVVPAAVLALALTALRSC